MRINFYDFFAFYCFFVVFFFFFFSSLCLSTARKWCKLLTAESVSAFPAMSCCEMQRAAASAAAAGAKSARPCDGCLRRRARWFCEADDAFLCQRCDVSVHSANPLARRHRRVCLKNASDSSSSSLASFSPLTSDMSSDDHATPAWLHGLKRKPRTPRAKAGLAGGAPVAAKVEPLVPDLEALSAEENQLLQEEELLYCVPILDPVLVDFCSHPGPLDAANTSGYEVKPPTLNLEDCTHVVPAAEGFAGFHPSDLDLPEFASDMETLDMETLLGRGLEDNSFGMAELGLMSAAAEDGGKPQVKAEMEFDSETNGGCGACDYTLKLDLPKETPEPRLEEGGSPAIAELEEEHKLLQQQEEMASAKRKILKLDYKAVVVAWSSNGCSPWMNGERPQLDLNDSWPGLSEMAGGGGGGEGMLHQQLALLAAAAVGEGREARVSRYREKRRTRLFSKKIRYEVRKLNAEKRPRMRGRFVKRGTIAAFPAVAPFLYR